MSPCLTCKHYKPKGVDCDKRRLLASYAKALGTQVEVSECRAYEYDESLAGLGSLFGVPDEPTDDVH